MWLVGGERPYLSFRDPLGYVGVNIEFQYYDERLAMGERVLNFCLSN